MENPPYIENYRVRMLRRDWHLIRGMAKNPASAHLDSYNEFLRSGMQEVVDGVGTLGLDVGKRKYRIRFGKLRIRRPIIVEASGKVTEITPSQARLRGLTYAGALMLDTKVSIARTSYEKTRPLYIGHMPIMVGSDACVLARCDAEKRAVLGEDPVDPGGYFIVSGVEHHLVGLEDLVPNHVIVEEKKTLAGMTHEAFVSSNRAGKRGEVRMMILEGNMLVVKTPVTVANIPAIILMRALGAGSDRNITSLITDDPYLRDELAPQFDALAHVETQDDAIEYVGRRLVPGMSVKRQRERTVRALDEWVMPHLPGKKNRDEKVGLLGDMAGRLLEVDSGAAEPDSRHHYSNKVVRFAGPLMQILFQARFGAVISDIRHNLRYAKVSYGIDAVKNSILPNAFTSAVENSIVTGNWPGTSIWLSRFLDRTNHIATISNLRRIHNTLHQTQPHYDARAVHPSSFGRICPCETPEGAGCGLVKQLALGAIPSEKINTSGIDGMLVGFGMMYAHTEGATRVIMDGEVIGYHHDGIDLARSCRGARHAGRLHKHTGICLVPGGDGVCSRLYIRTAPGRLLRPLAVVRDGAVPEMGADLDVMVQDGTIEMIDAAEEGNCLVASNPGDIADHTHTEIFPGSFLGLAASLVPYPEHNQSPRNTYATSMLKQAVGVASGRVDMDRSKVRHELAYPQSPAVETAAWEMIQDRPVGQNCVVAVLPFDGYNIEDAIVINRASAERGMGRSVTLKTYRFEQHLYMDNTRDKFHVPGIRDDMYGYKGEGVYKSLDEDGSAGVGSRVKRGGAVIGVTSPNLREPKSEQRRDRSVRSDMAGTVDRVILAGSDQGGMIFDVRVSQTRNLEVGDKLASRHGQKGVIGLLADAQDMPYTNDGITPDILINPHAFPSRMTVGQMIESVCGKAASLSGSMVDGTPFLGQKGGDVAPIMEKYGFEAAGKEVMYDGRTGKRLEADVFVGVVYYMKMRHMVSDKLRMRARGTVEALTKQPTRGKGGGLRFGEMERDCMIAYGASAALNDRLLDQSDKKWMYFCKRCGLVAWHNLRGWYECQVCGSKGWVYRIQLANTFRLFLQEAYSLGIAPRLWTRQGPDLSKRN